MLWAVDADARDVINIPASCSGGDVQMCGAYKVLCAYIPSRYFLLLQHDARFQTWLDVDDRPF